MPPWLAPPADRYRQQRPRAEVHQSPNQAPAWHSARPAQQWPQPMPLCALSPLHSHSRCGRRSSATGMATAGPPTAASACRAHARPAANSCRLIGLALAIAASSAGNRGGCVTSMGTQATATSVGNAARKAASRLITVPLAKRVLSSAATIHMTSRKTPHECRYSPV